MSTSSLIKHTSLLNHPFVVGRLLLRPLDSTRMLSCCLHTVFPQHGRSRDPVHVGWLDRDTRLCLKRGLFVLCVKLALGVAVRKMNLLDNLELCRLLSLVVLTNCVNDLS